MGILGKIRLVSLVVAAVGGYAVSAKSIQPPPPSSSAREAAKGIDPVPTPGYTREDLLDLGIFIVNCERDTRGVKVDFLTYHDPPYFVGAYPAFDFIDGGGYIEEVVTSQKSAIIPGDFTEMPIWVQVILPSRIGQVGGLHQKLTPEQVAHYKSPCNENPKPSVQQSVKAYPTYSWWYQYSVYMERYWGVQYTGITYRASSATTITFATKPFPSAVEGEEGIRYWPDKTASVSGDSYNPASFNKWCLMSDTEEPKYLMYKNGPMLAIIKNAITNTMEELIERYNNGETDITIELPSLDNASLELVRGEDYSSRTVAGPTMHQEVCIDIYAPPVYVTNTVETVEFCRGWGLHPLTYSGGPGKEILWSEMSNRTNASNRVYIPRLVKSIVTDKDVRTAQSFLGEHIVVTNVPTHWEKDFGVVDMPPGSNSLFRVHITPSGD